ncbi:hypothetical protein Ae201684P_010489 [Aphanomyces euteiches]|uniref:Uncharacterized protein n=1 Tax=Aphanomyces euteiches TaxID=100861 RepID=A0A6G0WB12_9STRA|nr:hypothetical protein Ae201684_016840 [Aphanomyces euteiches]KAH9076547.1 hypothetical protein Ae201684P_010489 [Aphanomyces euteiches]
MADPSQTRSGDACVVSSYAAVSQIDKQVDSPARHDDLALSMANMKLPSLNKRSSSVDEVKIKPRAQSAKHRNIHSSSPPKILKPLAQDAAAAVPAPGSPKKSHDDAKLKSLTRRRSKDADVAAVREQQHAQKQRRRTEIYAINARMKEFIQENIALQEQTLRQGEVLQDAAMPIGV